MPKEMVTKGKRFTVESRGGRGGSAGGGDCAEQPNLLHESFNGNEKAFSNSFEKGENHVRKQNTI